MGGAGSWATLENLGHTRALGAKLAVEHNMKQADCQSVFVGDYPFLKNGDGVVFLSRGGSVRRLPERKWARRR